MFLDFFSKWQPLREQADASGNGDQNDQQQQQQQQPNDQGNDGKGPAAVSFDAMTQALAEDNRSYIGKKGFKSFDDIIKTTQEQETRLGQSILLPKDPTNFEEMAPVYDRLGRPKSGAADASGYDFVVSEEQSKKLPYNKEFATTAAKKFHEIGLSKEQGRKVHDWFVGEQSGQFENNTKALMEHETKQHAEITKKWGDAGTDLYKKNTELATRAMVELGLEDTMKRRGILGEDGTLREASMAFALQQVGESMFSEGDNDNGDRSVGANPWAKETWNETQQGTIYRKDKDQAKTLMTAAGVNPADYGL